MAPKTEAGESLQRAIVLECMGNYPTMGILPTGGGKSLCYQIPALLLDGLTVVLHYREGLFIQGATRQIKGRTEEGNGQAGRIGCG